MKEPVSEEAVWAISVLSGARRVTVAAETRAPLGSVTVPVIAAGRSRGLGVWARANVAVQKARRRVRRDFMELRGGRELIRLLRG